MRKFPNRTAGYLSFLLLSSCNAGIQGLGQKHPKVEDQQTKQHDEVKEAEGEKNAVISTPKPPAAPQGPAPVSPNPPPAPGPGPSPTPVPAPVPPNYSSISVTPESMFLSVGSTRALTVTGDSGQGPEDLTTSADYESQTPAVATVDANGVVTAVSVGQSTVTASVLSGSVSDTVAVEVMASGALNPEFGAAGYVNVAPTTANSVLRALTIDSSGRIVVGGSQTVSGEAENFYINRYLADGSQDPAFTPAVINFYNNSDIVMAIGIQSTGKIVACGTAYVDGTAKEDIACVRLLTNGAIDNSFGTNGSIVTPINASGDFVNTMLIRADDSLRVVGSSTSAGFLRTAILALDADGGIDTSFATSGKLTQDLSPVGRSSEAFGIVELTDGKLVVGGYVQDTSGTYRFMIARFSGAGVLDTAFGGGDGYEYVAIPGGTGDQKGRTMVRSGDGYVVAGFSNTATAYDVGLVRFTADGLADTTFGTEGTGGVRTAFIGTANDQAHSLLVDGSGNLVIGGYYTSPTEGREFFVARYTSGGILDTTFGNSGSVTYSLADYNTKIDYCYALKLHPNGALIGAGYAELSTASGAVGTIFSIVP